MAMSTSLMAALAQPGLVVVLDLEMSGRKWSRVQVRRRNGWPDGTCHADGKLRIQLILSVNDVAKFKIFLGVKYRRAAVEKTSF